jgi:hypothetical protein
MRRGLGLGLAEVLEVAEQKATLARVAPPMSKRWMRKSAR